MGYDLVYVDPPYFYNERKNKSKFGCGAGGHYPLMKTEELDDFGIKVNSITNPVAIMFMWCTGPTLADRRAHRFMIGCGFEPKSIGFVWVKLTEAGEVFKRPGNKTAANAEICMIGIKGKENKKFIPKVRLMDQIVYTFGRTKHSEKPEEVVNRIEMMYPPDDFKCIEMFARRTRSNLWHYHGNEIEGGGIEL